MQSVDLLMYTYNIQYNNAIDVVHQLYVCHLSDGLKYFQRPFVLFGSTHVTGRIKI